MGQDVSVPVGTGTMNIYITEPDSKARGAVIVLQEAFGVNDHIRDLCHRFAAAGYVAVAPHLFHRSGDPELGYEDMQEVMIHIMQLEADKLEADLEATFRSSRINGIRGKAGRGGRLLHGRQHLLRGRLLLGAGRCRHLLRGWDRPRSFWAATALRPRPTLKTPWLGLFGDLDASIPVNEVEGLRGAAANTDPDTDDRPLPRRQSWLPLRRPLFLSRAFGHRWLASDARVARSSPGLKRGRPRRD